VTDQDFARWIKFRLYNNPEADENTATLHFRLNSVLAWKRSCSHFFPNNNIQYNEVTNQGNPTMSALMSHITRALRCRQTAGCGPPSSARVPFTPQEYEAVIEACWRMDNAELALCSSAFYTMQLSMVGRSDNTAKWRLPNLTPYSPYPDWVYCACFSWSKNVVEERDSPRQVLFGSMDPRFCPHANLGSWLEYHFELDPQENEFIFSYCGLDDPIHIKERIRGALNNVLRGDGFTVARVRVLGTHSVRKLQSTSLVEMGAVR
jgi:hypothetical protein